MYNHENKPDMSHKMKWLEHLFRPDDTKPRKKTLLFPTLQIRKTKGDHYSILKPPKEIPNVLYLLNALAS